MSASSEPQETCGSGSAAGHAAGSALAFDMFPEPSFPCFVLCFLSASSINTFDLRSSFLQRFQRGERREEKRRDRPSDSDQMAHVASSCVVLLTQRRGFAVAAAIVKGTGKRTEEKAAKLTVAKKDVTTATAAEEKAAWVPDPVTGYYRPASGPVEVDAAELRQKMARK